ncbi:MAG: S8 family serine peptidase, partial [Planctomycetota bacterium]
MTVVRPPPASLVFSVDPTDVVAGEDFAPAVKVMVADRFGSPVVGDTSPITLALGSNPGGATLGGTHTVTAQDGIATFGDLTLDRTGAGYTLVASTTGLSAIASVPFAVTPAVAAALAFSVEPSDATAGAFISPAVMVSVLDGFGNLVTNSTATIDIQLANNPGGSMLSGAARVDAVQGIATFSDLSLNKTGSGYALRASSSGLGVGTSQGFDVLPGQPAKLAFKVQPSDAFEDQVISPPVEVSILDPFDNIVSNATNFV